MKARDYRRPCQPSSPRDDLAYLCIQYVRLCAMASDDHLSPWVNLCKALCKRPHPDRMVYLCHRIALGMADLHLIGGQPPTSLKVSTLAKLSRFPKIFLQLNRTTSDYVGGIRQLLSAII